MIKPNPSDFSPRVGQNIQRIERLYKKHVMAANNTTNKFFYHNKKAANKWRREMWRTGDKIRTLQKEIYPYDILKFGEWIKLAGTLVLD